MTVFEPLLLINFCFIVMFFSPSLRPFTPQPGGLEFLPGHDYYFISTSTSDDLHRRIGGRCLTHNMKIVFKVWSPPLDATTKPPPQLPITRPPWPSLPPVVVAAAGPTTSTTTTTTLAPPPPPPPPTSTKKVKTYQNHPNEVMKSEGLMLGGASRRGVNSALCVLFVAALVLVAAWR